VLAHYTEDAVLVHPDGRRSVGHPAIRHFYATVFDQLETIDVQLVDLIGDGERAAVEWRADVVKTGGEQGVLRGVNLVTVREGRFTTVHVCFGEDTSRS
jgi:ketosteroid isomerase-like protein